MDPLRYRKAYEAMIHVSQLLEHRLNDNQPSEEKSEEDAVDSGAAFEIEDPDSMEWTPTATGTTTPPAGCGPPPSTATHMRHLLPGAGEGEYQLEDQGDNTVLLYKLQEGTVMDECIDRLVRDLPDVLSYENTAAFTPSTIEVPKDFGLQLSISINHHLAQVADRKVLEKYRRLLGHRKDSSKRKSVRLGFDAVELIQNQAIKFPENALVTKPTLDNEIHPIFRLENFHGCSDAIYEELKPALRLATMFLFSRGTFTFWHTLVFGDRKPCKETSEQYGQPCARIVEDVAWSDEHAAAFRDFMDKQVDTVHFMFHREPLPRDPAYASMGLVADYKNGIMRKLNGKCHTSRICLHSDFYTTAKKLSLLQYPEPAMVLRFNMFLAVCLAHEMAHFIEVSGPHHDHPLGQPEVFFNDNMWTESGIAFELKVFGGRLHPISSRVDCGLGLAVLSYPLRELYEKEDNVLYTLPMDYITKLQQKETWERDFSDVDATVFHVPRTGCRSIEINGINLMIWEDEKDVDISDDIDQLDTMYKRKDDGSIIKNPNSNNRTPKRHVEGRRWSPYGHKRKGTADTIACVSKEVAVAEEEGQEVKANESNESEEGTAAEASNSDDDMA